MRDIDDSHLSKQVVSEELELNQPSYEKLSNSFKKVYPRVYGALENFWFNSRMTHLKRRTLYAQYSKCIHKWEDYDLYKIGKCYICLKCHLLVESKVKGGRNNNNNNKK